MSEPPLSPASPPAARRDAIEFVLDLGHALHALGHPSHWLEDGMLHASARLGLVAQFFTTPTSIFAAFGSAGEQETRLLRVEPGDVHLERLQATLAAGRAVLAGRLTPAEGSRAIAAILVSPPRYSPLVTLLAFVAAGAAACRFLGGGVNEVATAALLGVLVAVLAAMAARSWALRRMFEPIAAFLVSAAATGLAHAYPLAIYVTTLSAILVLLPGLTLTVAMAELSSRHLVSGGSRLMGAAVQFFGLVFGMAMGSRLVSLLAGSPPPVTPYPMPGWTEIVALLLAPLAFTVLLRARWRDYPAILAVGACAFLAGRFGARGLGSELGAFLGAFAAAALSNRFASRIGGSPATTLVPALLLLVPGSIGFRSLTLLLNRDTLSGIEAAFRMLMLVAALVAGMLTAGILLPAHGLLEDRRAP